MIDNRLIIVFIQFNYRALAARNLQNYRRRMVKANQDAERRKCTASTSLTLSFVPTAVDRESQGPPLSVRDHPIPHEVPNKRAAIKCEREAIPLEDGSEQQQLQGWREEAALGNEWVSRWGRGSCPEAVREHLKDGQDFRTATRRP